MLQVSNIHPLSLTWKFGHLWQKFFVDCFCDILVAQVSQEDGHVCSQLFGNTGKLVRNDFSEINKSDKNFKTMINAQILR